MGASASRFLFRPLCALLLVGGALGASVSGSTPPAGCAAPVGALGEVPANIRSADQGLRSLLAGLASGSQVVRDMLDTIGHSDRALVTMRANARVLVEQRLEGLSTAGLSDGVLIVQVEVGDDKGSDVRRQAVLAHELAHVVEFVSLPRLPARTLASILMSREGHHAPWSSSMRIETAFARAVEQAVVDELQGVRPPAGLFRRLAERHGVDLFTPVAVVPCAPQLSAAR